MKPVIMGALMGLMMMWMLHGALAGETAWGAAALLAFVAGHVAIGVVVVSIGWIGVRLSPRLQRIVAHVHLPSLHHIGAMLGSAACVALVVHVVAHGLGGVA